MVFLVMKASVLREEREHTEGIALRRTGVFVVLHHHQRHVWDDWWRRM